MELHKKHCILWARSHCKLRLPSKYSSLRLSVLRHLISFPAFFFSCSPLTLVVVGTFRKSRTARNKCESEHILVDWKMKHVSERNAFISYTEKKFSVLTGSLFQTCQCLRTMKKDKRYIFVGDFDESSWALRLNSSAFMARRNGVAKRVLEDVDCTAVLGQS